MKNRTNQHHAARHLEDTNISICGPDEEEASKNRMLSDDYTPYIF